MTPEEVEQATKWIVRQGVGGHKVPLGGEDLPYGCHYEYLYFKDGHYCTFYSSEDLILAFPEVLEED